MKCLGEMELIHVIGACKIRDMLLLRLTFLELASGNIHPLIKVIKSILIHSTLTSWMNNRRKDGN